ncbi:PREDICTED: MAP7 domain-containing protein 3 isoform X1 [Propithecus coquereli]|uniref:MAP7 domain-containing protein 3 isoform X1 n=1 Tax=Propithecus coquereli TaxID=379532 RepID=UPI00063FB199|nr:PREDICTED: MAP7 domain-containing protein 3 isoform X1 [Propithecus coquereli]
MADRSVGAGGSTSLRGLRERMVAAAHAIAEERRNQSGVSPIASQSSNLRSACKPVIDGSVLKNDEKQRLAKERREEKRRQQDANKEMQLLEKARKAKIQYEKQMEEKQRKLREQKEKDEQRRISAEEKRKQKLEEERERYKAVLYRTLERSSRAELRQKRWSWEGSILANSESRSANKRSTSTEKLEQGTSAFHKQTFMSPAGLQNSVAKGKTEKKRSSSLNRRDSKLHSSTDTEQGEEKPAHRSYIGSQENNLISRLLIPTKASLARSKSAASLSIPGKNIPAINNHIFQHINVPSRSYSSDELKTTITFPKSTVKMPPQTKLEMAPQEKVEIPLKASVAVPPKVNVEAFPRASTEAPTKASMEASPKAKVEAPPEVGVEASPEANVEAPPEASVEVTPKASMHSSPEMSEDSSPLVSVNVSPVVSTDESLEVSVDTSPEVSLEVPPEESTEASPEVMIEVNPEVMVEAPPEASVEAPPKASPEISMEASPKAKKSEMDKQTSNSITKKCPSSYIPCYKWSSSPASGYRPPSPISTNRQIQKNRPPSPSPVVSKQSPQASLSNKIIPVQCTPIVQNTLGTVKKRREAVSKTTNKCEPSSQRHIIYEESGNKSTPGTMNAEEATKILAERRRLVREQREKEEEERLQQEMEPSVIREMKDVAEKAVEGQVEEFSKLEDEQGQKDTKKKKGCQDQEDQEVLLQKGDTKIKAQEEADKRKKEHERIMLQNLQERLERKKRIEEIMKRTRKTDVNASKAAQTSGNDTYEEDEADDEDESESDEDSLDEMFPSAMQNGRNSPTKLKAKKMSHKLVFLEATTGQVRKESKTYFNGDLKTFKQKSMKDPLTQIKGSRPSTKRTRRTAKTGKVNGSNTIRSSLSLNSKQEWICDKMTDIRSHPETSVSHIPPDDHKHNLKDSMTFCQSPQTPLDDKRRSKPVSPDSDE